VFIGKTHQVYNKLVNALTQFIDISPPSLQTDSRIRYASGLILLASPTHFTVSQAPYDVRSFVTLVFLRCTLLGHPLSDAELGFKPAAQQV
jgi:hypothetical protein